MTMYESAVYYHELKESFVAAGFSPEEVMQMTLGAMSMQMMIAATRQNPYG